MANTAVIKITVCLLIFLLVGGSLLQEERNYKFSFEKRHYEYVKRYQADIDPDLPLAQISVETWHGWKVLQVTNRGVLTNSRNLFNIKAYPPYSGPKGYAWVIEYQGTNRVRIRQYFRIYETEQAAVDEYIRIISNPEGRFYSAWKVRHDPRRYLEELQKNGWGTHPDFIPAILNRMEGIKEGRYHEKFFYVKPDREAVLDQNNDDLRVDHGSSLLRVDPDKGICDGDMAPGARNKVRRVFVGRGRNRFHDRIWSEQDQRTNSRRTKESDQQRNKFHGRKIRSAVQ